VNPFEQMAERIKTNLGVTDPEKIEMISRVTVRYGELQSRALSGEDVAQDLAVIEATALSLDSATRRAIGNEIQSFATTALSGILTRLLAGT